MTKVTDFDSGGLPVALGGWSTGYPSIGSNTDSNPPLSALNFVQRITANTSNTLLNPIVNFASGTGITLAAASNTITISSSGGGGSISAGSNSTAVQEISTAGASTTLWSPYDHAHAGIATITASSSNTLQRGTFNLRAGSGIAISLTDTDGDGEFDTATLVNTATASSVGAASSTHPLPLDSYAIDGTYGDDFNGSALSGIWTRRNFTSTAETYQYGPRATHMRIVCTGRAAGDGYYQTAPGGDWTFAMSWILHYGGSNPNFGIAVINSVGTGLGCSPAVTSGTHYCTLGITTYTSYSGSFQQLANAESSFVNQSGMDERKWWCYLRKSGTNYYAAFALNGDTWSSETPAFSSSITVDRIGMIFHPQSTFQTAAIVDVDIFNRIA